MKQIYRNIRYWLIIKLASKDMVLINAEIADTELECLTIIDNNPGSSGLVYGCKFLGREFIRNHDPDRRYLISQNIQRLPK